MPKQSYLFPCQHKVAHNIPDTYALQTFSQHGNNGELHFCTRFDFDLAIFHATSKHVGCVPCLKSEVLLRDPRQNYFPKTIVKSPSEARGRHTELPHSIKQVGLVHIHCRHAQHKSLKNLSKSKVCSTNFCCLRLVLSRSCKHNQT